MKNTDFIIGCNYWASNAGTKMWSRFDEMAIEKDLKTLSEYGLNTLRVFPMWSDFQTVEPLLFNDGNVREYRMKDERKPSNPYYLEEVMLERFEIFLDLCKKYGIKVIVGLITGWMSGRLFIPTALNGKNLYTDETALWFEQLFIRGFVKTFKHREEILAWDLGNECCGISKAENRYVTATWTAIITNAIKAEDNTRKVISGMHRFETESIGVKNESPYAANWRLFDHAQYVDVMTTHPYPFWFDLTKTDRLGTIKPQLHATCENKFFADLSGLPCFVEEVGNMGNSVTSDKVAADYLRTQLFSVWANDGGGVMWWCANEQTMLDFPPYTWQMCEVELGLTDRDGKAKETLAEYKKFAEWRKKTEIDLPKAECDGVCILTHEQNQYASALSSYILAKQAGINLSFAWCESELPESDVYLMPSVTGIVIMDGDSFKKLRERIYRGATLYVSSNGGIISEFESLTGMRINDSDTKRDNIEIEINGKKITSQYGARRNFLSSVGGKVIAESNGLPVVTEYEYGKGKVIYLDFPIENNLAFTEYAYEGDACEIYRYVFSDKIANKKIEFSNKDLTTTYHEGKDGKKYAVTVNYSENEYKCDYKLNGVKIKKALYGNAEAVKPYDAVVLELE